MLRDRGFVFALEQGGKALIAGFTTKKGVPISCPVRVYHRNTGVLLSHTISNNNGRYVTVGSRQGSYVIAVDPLEEYNIAVQDNVK